LLTALLVAMAFLAGAVAEKTAHFMQDVVLAAPIMLDQAKEFLQQRVIFKVNTAAEQLKWAAVIIISIVKGSGNYVIRGP